MKRMLILSVICVLASSGFSTIVLDKGNNPSGIPDTNPEISIPAKQNMLYQDDFEKPPIAGWKNLIGNWRVEEENNNHYLSGSGESDFPQAWLAVEESGSKWIDYAFEARIRLNKGWIHLCLRAEGGSAFYAAPLSLDDVNFSFAKYIDKKYERFGSAPFRIEKDKWYLVRFEVEGEELRLFIDNNLVTKTTQKGRDAGGIGFYIGGGHKVDLDDIRVWGLGEKAALQPKYTPQAQSGTLIYSPQSIPTLQLNLKNSLTGGAVYDTILSPDYRRLLLVKPGEIQMMDIESGAVDSSKKLPTQKGIGLLYVPKEILPSPDGKTFAYTYYSIKTGTIIDAKTFSILKNFSVQGGYLGGAIAYSPDGRYFASGEYDKLTIYRTKDWGIERTYQFSCQNAIAFAPDGKSVFCTSPRKEANGEIYYHFDLTNSSPNPKYVLERDKFYDLRPSPDGRIVAGKSYHHGVNFWLAPSGENFCYLDSDNDEKYDQFRGSLTPGSFYSFTPDGNDVWLLRSNMLQRYHIRDCSLQKTITLSNKVINFRLSLDGEKCVIMPIGSNGFYNIEIISLDTGKVDKVFTDYLDRSDKIESPFYLTPDETGLFYFSSGSVAKWDFQSKTVKIVFKPSFKTWVYSLSKDQSIAVFMAYEDYWWEEDRDKFVVYSTSDWKLIKSFTDTQKFADPENFDRDTRLGKPIITPDNTRIIIAHQDQIKIWSIKKGKIEFVIDNANINDYALSPDGKIIAVSGKWGIRFYDASNGKRLSEISLNIQQTQIGYFPDSSALAVLETSGKILVIASPDAKIIRDFSLSKPAYFKPIVSLDGKILISSSFYSIPLGKELNLSSTTIPTSISYVTQSADGKKLAIQHWDGRITIWEFLN